MNIRSLCFARVARERGEPWLWWDFVDRLGRDCPIRDKKYTAECAQQVGPAGRAPGRGRGPKAGAAQGGAPRPSARDVAVLLSRRW
jgi:hypothetical protein